MRFWVFVVAVLAVGIALVLIALTVQQPVLQAERIAMPPVSAAEPVRAASIPAAEQSVEVIAVVEQTPSQSTNATHGACLILEQRLQKDVEDAEQELHDAQDEYEDAAETYDDALEIRNQDEPYIAKLKRERDEAQEAQDDAEDAYNTALKRLSRARIECGLFG